MLLATKQAVENAYVVVTTNGAVGTDQDANTFWDKIKENFVHIITKYEGQEQQKSSEHVTERRSPSDRRVHSDGSNATK